MLIVIAGVLSGVSTPSARAEDDLQLLHVLLSGDPLAPTPTEVVTAIENGDHAPLVGVETIRPHHAGYVMPVRAHGDAHAWLLAHPDSARAQLERYIVLAYSPAIDLRLAIDALLADPWVGAAYQPIDSQFTSAELIGFGIEPEPAGNGQYGRDAMNIDEAWTLAGGYALVGVPDTGLEPEHPLLRQFDATGNHIGGNFVVAASADIGQDAANHGGGNWTPDYIDYNVDELES
jgi:hypothetical protein